MTSAGRLARVADGLLEASVAGSFTSIGLAARRRLFPWRDLDTYDLSGRHVMVTGTTTGLGRALAQRLAAMGATVHTVNRHEERARLAAAEIAAATGSDRVEVHIADLTSLDSTRALADTFRDQHDRLDALVHNAGAMFDDRQVTDDGIERTVALHVVAPWLLTERLLPTLRATGDARVLTMSSGGMYGVALDVRGLQSPGDYRPTTAYARAKRAQVVLTEQWARRHGEDAHFHALHPGWALTPGVERSLPGFRRLVGPLLRTPEQGADTAAWLVADDEALRRGNGLFWHDRRPRSVHRLPTTRRGDGDADDLWAEVAELAGAHTNA